MARLCPPSPWAVRWAHFSPDAFSRASKSKPARRCGAGLRPAYGRGTKGRPEARTTRAGLNGFFFLAAATICAADILRLQSFGSLFHVELHPLPFVERAIPRRLDRRVMDE